MHGLALAQLRPDSGHQAQGLGPSSWVLARCNPLGDVFLQDINIVGPWAAADGHVAGAEDWACIAPPVASLVRGSQVSSRNSSMMSMPAPAHCLFGHWLRLATTICSAWLS